MTKQRGTQPIRTQRLLLRPLVPEDAPAVYRNWASDPQVTKYLTWPPHQNPATTEFVVNDWVRNYSDADFYQWAITLQGSPEPIGTISGLRPDHRIGKVEVGYCLGRSWWHQGIMSEALSAVIWYLMEVEGFQRVEATHDRNNPNSGAVMRKCGMEYEGTFRRAGYNNQGICDLVWYARLK